VIEVIEERLSYLHPFERRGDDVLVERIWAKVDHALRYRRIEISDEVRPWGTVRVVTALGLLQLEVDYDACDMIAFAILEDGSRRRIGPSFRGPYVFGHPQWLRWAFLRWAPECSGIDYVADPLSRPSNIEVETSGRLARRLRFDYRYWTLPHEFYAAVGRPMVVSDCMSEARALGSNSLEYVCEAWRAMESRCTTRSRGV
jgi:hypothetical protein